MTLPNACLVVASRPENVVLVRELLAGVADAVGLDRQTRDDAATAVSEACNNVVQHAYRGSAGPLEVQLRVLSGMLGIVCRDHGSGLGASDPANEGYGLAAIRAFSDRVEFRAAPGEGTEVRMEFDAPDLEGLAQPGAEPVDVVPAWALEPRTALELTVEPPLLAQPVLGRLVPAMAARADFSIDRLSDAQLIADALAAGAVPLLTGDRMAAAVSAEPRRLELRIGPLAQRGATKLPSAIAFGVLQPMIESLADRVEVRTHACFETLELLITDRP